MKESPALSLPMGPKNRIAVNWGESLRKYGLITIIAALCIVFTCLNGVFISPSNLLNIVRQASVMIIFSVGVTFVMIGGMMDLSVSGVACVTSMVAAIIMDRGGHPGLAFACAILVGMGFGAFNGVLSPNSSSTPSS